MSDRLLSGAIDIPLTTLLIILMATAIFDLKDRRIPNPLVAMSLATTLIAFPLLQLSPWAHAVIGSLTGLLLFMPFYAIGFMGAGDVKLLAIVGSVLGPAQLFTAALYIFIAGGVVTVLYMLSRRATPPAQDVPYAVAIALGVLGYLVVGTS